MSASDPLGPRASPPADDLSARSRGRRPRSTVKIALVTLAVVIVAALACVIWNPFAAAYAKGVDVSQAQGPIDWRTLAQTDIRFAYIKATEGGDHVDPRFAFNWREAGAAGLHRGAYHYFTLCRPGAQQAANFIRTVPREVGALPPVLDLEHIGPCRQGPTAADIDGEVRAFVENVQAHYGERPLIYVGDRFAAAHPIDFHGERHWVRSLYAPPLFGDRWLIWQLDNNAHRRGISGPVDLDAFRGDAAALAKFSGGA